MKGATQKASSESLGSITNSFSMQINRRTNPGTPRGAGNLRGEDIEKISQVEGITSSIKRINAIADILDHEIIETEETLQNQSPERAKHFKNTLMVTGVNDSSKEDKFVSGAYKLVQGEHLTDKDKNQILMHEDLAKKNGLKVGDKVRLKSNLYDADNEKGANETVEVTIKGLFSGKNQAPLTYAQELYEDTLISDLRADPTFAASGVWTWQSAVDSPDTPEAGTTLSDYVGANMAQDSADALNYLADTYEAGTQVTYKVYSPEEIAADATRDGVELYYWPSEVPGSKFVGGHVRQCAQQYCQYVRGLCHGMAAAPDGLRSLRAALPRVPQGKGQRPGG